MKLVKIMRPLTRLTYWPCSRIQKLLRQSIRKQVTLGYYYELLVRGKLARGKTKLQFDVLATYLSHLAYNVYLGGGNLSRTSSLNLITLPTGRGLVFG